MNLIDIVPIFLLSTLAFIISMSLAPALSRLLYKYKWWKSEVRTVAPDGKSTETFSRLHKDRETSIPRMAGVLIWITTFFLALLFWILGGVMNIDFFAKLNFISRSQTWIPLFTLISASILGLIDDILVVRGFGEKKMGGGIRFRHRLALVFVISLIGAYWFFFKLGWSSLHVPLVGDFNIGLLFIPLFIFVMFATFSSGIIDGLDGLAGGIFAIIFSTFAAIAFSRGQMEIATLCGVIAGSLVGFLWFNIPPAKFFMGETGILGLTTTLAVIAFITDSVILMLVICFVLWLESGSVIIQLLSKKFLGRKVFLSSPLHHHFEAKGIPAYSITMKFWMITAVTSIIGLTIAVLDKTYTLPFLK